VTLIILKVLHKIALGIDLNDADARELAALQTRILIPAALPARLARSLFMWKQFGAPTLATKEKYMSMYKQAIKKRWPGDDWTDRKLNLVASAYLDAILQAGGRSVPLAIDVVLGYILSKNKPADLVGVDFTKEANIRSLLFEAMRYHPVVTTLPIWTTKDGGATWLHEAIGIGPALADPKVWPEPDEFRLDRPEAKTVAWADFAIVNNDTAHPDTRMCPGKILSISMVIAFVQAFQAAGPWDLEDDNIRFDYYGASGFAVTKADR